MNRNTAEEIEKKGNRLKNNKSAGPDLMVVGTRKYATCEVIEKSLTISNMGTESENYATILRGGILTSLQTIPNKKKKPVENLCLHGSMG